MKYLSLGFVFLMALAHCTPTAPRMATTMSAPTAPPDTDYVTFGGGDGETVKDAIVVENARNSTDGIAAEYRYLEEKFGEPGIDWSIVSRGSDQEDGRTYDWFAIDLSGTGQKTIYFDVSAFYGKW